MFLVQGSVLLSTSKIEFATYSLACSYVVMGQTVLSALFGGPLLTLLGDFRDDLSREAIGSAILRLQLAIALVVGGAGLGTALMLGLPPAIVALTVAGLIGLSFRDALRSVLAAQLQFGRAMIIALAFAAATSVLVGAILLIRGHLTAELGLGALAVGSLATMAAPILSVMTTPTRVPLESFRRLMSMAAWSLPGAAVIWLQNSFYLTVVALNLSMDAVGEISAARMIVMPMLITASGLLRFAQVHASRILATNEGSRAVAFTRRVARICLLAGVVVASLCWIVEPFINPRWLPRSHPHLLSLAGAWILFAAANVARGSFSSLFQAMGRYREIFLLNLVLVPFVLAAIAICPHFFGLIGAVLPMAAGELMLLALLSHRLQRGGVHMAIG